MKKCRVCLIEKPLTDFSPQKRYKDGHTTICNLCKREWQREYRKTERYKQYRFASKEKRKQWIYNFRHTLKGKLYLKRRNDRIKKLHPEKIKAGEILRYAIKTGKIKRLPCIKCGNPKSQGHHTDHSKPLEVMWLCQKHHIEHHLNQK